MARVETCTSLLAALVKRGANVVPRRLTVIVEFAATVMASLKLTLSTAEVPAGYGVVKLFPSVRSVSAPPVSVMALAPEEPALLICKVPAES